MKARNIPDNSCTSLSFHNKTFIPLRKVSMAYMFALLKRSGSSIAHCNYAFSLARRRMRSIGPMKQIDALAIAINEAKVQTNQAGNYVMFCPLLL